MVHLAQIVSKLQTSLAGQLFLNIVDWATGLGPPVSKKLFPYNQKRQKLPERRIAIIGSRSMANRNNLFATNMAHFEVILALEPGKQGLVCSAPRLVTEAPWQNARTERRGGKWTSAFEAALSEANPTSSAEYFELVAQVTSAMNDLARRRGYSPNAMVFGRSPHLPGSLLELDPDQDIQVYSQATADSIVQRALDLRTTARAAVLRHENDRSIRKSTSSSNMTTA